MTATAAPAAASNSTLARPMPLAPPVTAATRPFKPNKFSIAEAMPHPSLCL
jgi:hypothetical protein